MNCSVYLRDAISINIDANSNILFENLGNNAKDASNNTNESTACDSIIGINLETKNYINGKN